LRRREIGHFIARIAEVGGPQRCSANRKSANLRTYKICNICGLLTGLPKKFADLRFADFKKTFERPPLTNCFP
jgi:hypothetical protein